MFKEIDKFVLKGINYFPKLVIDNTTIKKGYKADFAIICGKNDEIALISVVNKDICSSNLEVFYSDFDTFFIPKNKNAEEKLNPKYEAKEFLDLFLKMNDIDLVDLENYIKENSKKYSL